MKKEEIKIGQKVRISENMNWNGSAGKVGTIVEIDDDGDALVYLGEGFDGHRGYNQDNDHNLYVGPKNLTLVEDVQEQPVSKFKVGDIVTVVDNGETYSAYKKFFYINNCEELLENWKIDDAPTDNFKYKIVFIGKHKCGCTLLVIQSPRTKRVYIISEKGVELYNKPTFKAGDKVRIRQWDDMKAEFGLNSCGSVDCTFAFTESMQDLCGKEFTIKDIQSDGEVLGLNTNWNISTDMIELVVESKPAPAKPKPSKLVVGAKVKVVNPQFSDFSDWGGKIGMIGTIVNVSEQNNGQDYLVYLGEDFDGHDGMWFVSERQDNKHNYFFKAEEIEVVDSILDDIEIKYLSAVIKPFRNRVTSIQKVSSGKYYYIEFDIEDEDVSMLPSFKKSTGMYAGMKANHKYSLEELGL